ncbi:FAD-dependent oxidoreductase [Anaerobacillus alkalilacustris]|uniref:FAD-dependent oxidoreductase n=1 Tax=Anaerobacillus alkalilacustris TaxID=393763 RepID=A0A1S2LH21_9BACI|nr:FAD-dependent oxidoreductase [Anaerobacillus alkalilacustris]OIJ11818.1 FAD-dependent oxidoreductase [Anaerobacillus alkalilacustris]
MDLQSGKLYWPTTITNKPTYLPLDDDLTCDVLIVGGGSSGAQAAYYLSQLDMNIIVIDKRDVGAGSTSTNTALLQYSGDKMFFELVSTFGEERSARHLKLCQKAIDDIEIASKKLPYHSHFTRRDSLYFSSSLEDVEKIDKEYHLLKKHGFDVTYFTKEQIKEHYPFYAPAAIYSFNDGELNPLAFTYGLLEKAKDNGVKIFANTELVRKKFCDDYVQFFTNNQKSIKAKYVIFTAGYENLEFKKEKNTTISSSYAIVTQPLENFWYNRTLIWETARPYMYMRTTHDNRIIIGGLDETTAFVDRRDSMLIHKRDQLVRDFNQLFPSIHIKPDYYLAAFYGGTHDGMPILGMYDDHPNCYFIYGYGDNGLVYSTVLTQIIRDLIHKGSSDNVDLYIQSRPQL